MTKPNDEAERRVLDMLYGWFNYTSDHPEFGSPAETLRIIDLYGELGNLSTDPSESPTIEQLEAFIKDKVVPLLLNGVS